MTPDPCAWCSEPASHQVYMGTGTRGRHYAWLCVECSREAEYEKRYSQNDD